MKKLSYILICFLCLIVSNGFSQNCVLRVNASIRYNGWEEACPIENIWVDLANATFNGTSTWYDGNGEYRVASFKSGENGCIEGCINNDVVYKNLLYLNSGRN